MEPRIPGFKRRWELSAPESYLLLYGPQNWARTQALKLALVELVARGRLSIEHDEQKEQRSLLGRRKAVSLLGPGGKGEEERQGELQDDHSLARPLAAMLNLAEDAGIGEPPDRSQTQSSSIPLTELLKKVRKKYGWPGGYAEAEVMPGLEDRGLYERRDWLWSALSSNSDWELTKTGGGKKEELREGVFAGEDRFAEWVDQDPQLALSFLGYAGSAALLVPGLHGDLKRLMDRHKELDATWPTVGPGVPDGAVIGDAENYSGYPGTFSLEGFTLDFDILDGLEVSEAIGPLVAGAGGGGGGDSGGVGGAGV